LSNTVKDRKEESPFLESRIPNATRQVQGLGILMSCHGKTRTVTTIIRVGPLAPLCD